MFKMAFGPSLFHLSGLFGVTPKRFRIFSKTETLKKGFSAGGLVLAAG